MKGLPTLIRLRRQELDEKRRTLVEIEQREAFIERDIEALDDEVTGERAFVGSAEDVRFAYENFALAARTRRENLVGALAEVRVELEDVREEVAEAFREYKKYDIAEENDQRRQQDERDRLERIDSDEIGTEIHRRANR
ncbi:MAG: flagellar FliJ family protein [Rhodospirillales bacterium]|nr:flagellar FliJ family protein [Rhodospirillales bacterium]